MFSIIVPVYNVARYLRESLDSVLAQMFSDWECICVDDGSSDGSEAILDEYAAKDPRFKVVHKENGGVSSARNTGLDVAAGDWIAFLDADDVWAPWTLDYAARAIDANRDADLVCFDTATFSENGNVPWHGVTGVPFAFRVEDVSKAISAGSTTCFFWGKIYRLDVVSETRFGNYTVGEDLLFLAQCMARARRQVHVSACCYGYRQRIGSASHSDVSVRTLKDELGFVPGILQIFNTSGKTVDKALWRLYSNKLMEGFAFSLCRVDDGASEKLWREWMDVVGRLRGLKKLPRFQRFRIALLLLFPFRAVAYVLCTVPYLLKVKLGISR